MLNWASSVWKSGSAIRPSTLSLTMAGSPPVSVRFSSISRPMLRRSASNRDSREHPGEHVEAAPDLLAVALAVLARELPARHVLAHGPFPSRRSPATRDAPARNLAHQRDTPPRLRGCVQPSSYVRPMRLLHTSDWHLGRSFHREDLLGAQAQFVDFLVETVRSERVDAVVVSGDVYDRALPSLDAVAVCDDALRPARRHRRAVVIISGNHDSARRLGFGAGLIDAAGIHLRTDPAGAARRWCSQDEHGDGGRLRRALPRARRGPGRAGLRRAQPCGGARRRHGPRPGRPGRPAGGTRSVVLAHAFVTGGEASDSERDISVGGVGAVPAAVFAGVDYVALGPPARGAAARPTRSATAGPRSPTPSPRRATARACARRPRTPGGVAPVEPCRLPVPRPLARAPRRPGGPADRRPVVRRTSGHCLQVTLTDPVRPREPMERLRSRFPHVLVLGFEPEGGRRHRHRAVRRPAARPHRPRRSPGTSSSTSAAPARRGRRRAPARAAFERGPRWPRRAPDAPAPPHRHRLRPLRRHPGVDFDALAAARALPVHGRPARARPASWTPSASPCTARCLVPGGRRRALRSDHAPAAPAPRSCLEVDRARAAVADHPQPAWDRPKRRGSGHHHGEGPAARSRRDATGGWTDAAPTRLDEVGEQITELLGMSLAQFCQVVLLPQGDFAGSCAPTRRRAASCWSSCSTPAGSPPSRLAGRPAAGAGAGAGGRRRAAPAALLARVAQAAGDRAARRRRPWRADWVDRRSTAAESGLADEAAPPRAAEHARGRSRAGGASRAAAPHRAAAAPAPDSR